MAGMFYSLEEAAAKLNKTEQEVKELAKEGKLREFRDGSNLLFKIDEVNALMTDISVTAPTEASLPLEKPADSAEMMEPESISEEEVAKATEPEAAETPEAKPAEALESETAEVPEQPIEPEKQAAVEEKEQVEEEISLAGESAAPAVDSDLTAADTALTSEGISILGETDRDYQLTDDTMSETTISPGTTGTAGITGTTGEASLEEIEEDVSLDSFGSGSGLLDLSLQADDTSLGGILDEIYTAEGGEEGQEPPAEPTSAVEMVAEAESAAGGISEEELAAPPVGIAPEVSPIAQPYIEAPPDALGNSLGVMLFLPLLAIIYAGIVAIAGLKGVKPAILGKIQMPYIGLYIMAGLSVAALLTFGFSFMLSGGIGTAGTKKEKKPKKPKKQKPKKEKRAKKAKKAAKEQ
jgi:excisionase family DNA binding protein